MWANGETMELVDDVRSAESQRTILEKDGLHVIFSTDPGIVEAGTAIAVSTNVPADLAVAVDTGALLPYAGPIVLDHDATIRVEAVAHVQSSTGSLITMKSTEHFYMLKNRYPTLRVSEAYPSPKTGETEWVEVWNPTDGTIPLAGWSIDDVADGGSRPVPFPIDAALAPGEYRRIDGLSIVWNNDGDDVRLIAPNGKTSDETSYGPVKKGTGVAMTFGSNGRPLGSCATVHATPGAPNRCAEAPPKIAKKKASKKTVATARKHEVRYRNLLSDAVAAPERRSIFSRLSTVGVARESFPIAACAWIAFLALVYACGTVYVTRAKRDCP
jgi:hypothetical protein